MRWLMVMFFSLVMAVVALVVAQGARQGAPRARLESSGSGRLQAGSGQPAWRAGAAAAPPHVGLNRPPLRRPAAHPTAGRDRAAEPVAASRRTGSLADHARHRAAAPHGPRRARPQHGGTLRHPMGGLGRRWLALGGFFLVRYSIEQGCSAPACASLLGALLALARSRRRMDAAARKAARRSPRSRPHTFPRPDRRRHRGRLCRRLRRLCALRLPAPGHGFRPARAGSARHARRRLAARPGACRPRPRRRLCHAAARRLRQAELLGALHLSRGRHRRGLCAGAGPAVALARDHGRRARRCSGPSPAAVRPSTRSAPTFSM